MQNSTQSYTPKNQQKKVGEPSEKSSTPQSIPCGTGADTIEESRPKFISDSSESEEDDVSEVESFMIEQDVDDRLENTKFLLSAPCADSVDPETQERLEALLQAAGIGRLSAADGKHLADPDVLRRLTSSVSCALDEAAAALTRMRSDHPRPQETRSLVEACSDGDVSTVRKLLTEGGKSVHETNEEGESLLSLACSAGYLELAQVLLAMNANVEDRGVKGDCTPLMEASSAGHVDIVALLLNHNASVNAQSSSGNTALMYACAGGHEEVVKLLLECAANVEDHNENGHTPLMEAASAGHVGVAQILLNYGAGINTHSNEFKESALTLACYKGHLDMVRFLLEAGADQEHKTDEMHTALMEASMDGHVEVARLLLDSGAQVNMPTDSFESPLTLAACGGHTELAMLLIERGANIEEVNDEGYTPLMEAAREGHEDMVALLLSQGANINAQTEETQETALTLACCGGFLEVADFLLKAGADLEAGASTPLMEAAQEGHLDLVRYLLEYHHANVNAQTQTGDTALTYACENGHTDVASLLLLYGANMEHESEGGRTPLMKACRAGHTYTVQYLISKNADVNKTTTSNDHTPLSLAASGGHLAVVELLLANRADPFHRLKDNSTMLIEAAKGGHTNVVHLLLDYPHSVMLQAPGTPNPAPVAPTTVPASTPAAVPAPAPDESPPTTQANPSLVQGPRSLLRKLRPPSSTEPGLTSAEAQQVRSQPVGEPAPVQGEMEEKPELPTQPSQVSQSTAISDRPKAKPFSKKDGKNQRKAATGQAAPPPTPAALTENQVPTPVEPSLLQTTPHPDQVDSATGHLYHVQAVDAQGQKQPQQVWMLQRSNEEDWDEVIAAMEPDSEHLTLNIDAEAKEAKETADQIDTLVMDFAHKLEAFNINDVTNAAEQERLILRARQQLSGEEPLAEEEVYNLPQDVTYITVPTLPAHQHQTTQHVQYQYQHLPPVDLTSTPIPIPNVNVNGRPLTVTRTTEGSIQITPTGQLKLSAKEYSAAFATGFQHGRNYALTAPAPALAAVAPAPVAPTTCCPAEPPARTQATQTTVEKKAQLTNYTQPKGKKNRFSQQTAAAGQRHSQPSQTDLTGGVTQCTGTFPAPPLQLSACMDVDSETDSNHDTALTLACAGGHEELVELLLSRGADIEHRDKKGFTPLILAATAGHEKVVEILLNHGADIEAQSERTKDTPLSLACSGGRYEVVELLLNKMANKEHRNVSDYTPLSLAASGGYVNIIKLLLNHGAEINSRTGSKLGISPLMLASMNGHVAAVKLLLDMGSDINAQIETNRNTALTLACFQGRHEVVSLLLDRKANVEHRAKTGLTPLMEAASGGYVDVGRVLIDKGADVNASPVPSSRDTALTIAADKGHVRFVELLLSRNAMVEVKNKKGNSPLWLAANGGHLAVIELLYNLDADIDSQDNRKVSCLMAAFRKGHVKVVKWMVNHVTQFPSDQEMTRFIATISDKELLDKCHECVKLIRAAKDLQSAKANKNASILLEELDMEKTREESKKAAAARRRERKKKKKLEKKEEKRKLYEEQKPESEEDDEYAEEAAESVNESSKQGRLGSSSPVPDKEEGDSGIDANSQGSCSSNDVVKLKETRDRDSKRKEKKKKKNADKTNEPSHSKQEIKEVSNERRIDHQQQQQPPPQLMHQRNGSERMREPVEASTPIRVQQHPADRDDFEATGNETYVPATKSRKNHNNNNTNYTSHHEAEPALGKTNNTSPKGANKREEGWKEVVRNFPYRSKKVSVPLNAISRVIGRGGSNINAIRAATGAHIEVEKQGKGQGERIITIKGSVDATKQAHNLIAILIRDPDVDIVQMLPKSNKTAAAPAPTTLTMGTWEKPAAVPVSKPKVVGVKSPSLMTAPLTPTNTVSITNKQVTPPTVLKQPGPPVQSKLSPSAQQSIPPLQSLTSPVSTVNRLLQQVGSKPQNNMSYTSVMMTTGARTPKATVPTSAAPAPIAPPIARPVPPLGPPSTAPVSPQVSPPQPLPPSPKHHRPHPTSSAPPSMQQSHQHHLAQHQQQLAQQQLQDMHNHNLLQEYSLFNDGFANNVGMWGREQEASGKLNFASVAATGTPPGMPSGPPGPPPSKFLDELPTQVDASKAPGYRAKSSLQTPLHSNYDPSTSPRGAESGVIGQAPIAPPLFGPRVGFGDPTMYQGQPDNNLPIYQLQPSPPPASVAMSRLNPRAPDFSYGTTKRWTYGPNTQQDLMFPDLLTYDNGLVNTPNMSPSSPGELKMEERKPRPIGTERNWKHTSTVMNGYDQLDPSWLAGAYRTHAAPSPYRNLHDELGLIDPSYAGGLTEAQYHNGTALAQQLILAQQMPVQVPPLDPTNTALSWDPESWTAAKWTH